MSGFYIRQLSVRGINLRDAIITFKKGANLITGASDTGKSYIFSAISYGLGASEPPKEFNEGLGYNEIYLEIETNREGDVYTLFRRIGQNKIEIKSSSIDNFEDSAIDIKQCITTGGLDKEEHISTFLLSLCDLKNKKLLYKQSGVTHKLSFDNLRKLTFVDEERIIKTASPFYFSSQFSNQTKGQALLSLLLTGEDFSDVKERESKNIKEIRIKGKLEFLSYQVSKFALRKDELITDLNNSLVKDKDIFFDLDKQLQISLSQAKELTVRKNEVIIELQKFQDDLLYTLELLHRFGILEKQYVTDTERLEFILESSNLAAQLGDTVCPICSSSLDENHLIHLTEERDFKDAAREEIRKNISKLHGLKETITSLQFDENNLRQKIMGCEQEMKTIENELSDNLSPKIQLLKEQLSELLDSERLLNNISFIDAQISSLYEEKNRLENALKEKEKEGEITILPFDILSDLSSKVESRLESWNYEPLVKVDFDSSYRSFDIIISGKSRKSYGKGKRAISYASCLFGLLDYCKEMNRGFSNLLVLDSPLTTFEEKKKEIKDSNEILTTQVLKSFFVDFGNLPEDSQVIIFDNKEPDPETFSIIKEKIYIQTFTGSDEGRKGFFPS